MYLYSPLLPPLPSPFSCLLPSPTSHPPSFEGRTHIGDLQELYQLLYAFTPLQPWIYTEGDLRELYQLLYSLNLYTSDSLLKTHVMYVMYVTCTPRNAHASRT
jgi:hypothetical protein